MKKQLLIAGGSGLIGSALAKEALHEGWYITILSRHPGSGRVVWDPAQGTIDFHGKLVFDAIINLAGASIADGRWTEEKKKEIYQSRINACRTLEKYLLDGRLSTSFYLGVSGVGIYGDNGMDVVSEETTIDNPDDWLVKTVLDWESAHKKIADLSIRTVILRIGIVLSTDGGALKEILGSPGFGVLSYFGHGNQIWPWIHIGDLTRLIFFCINHTQVKGTFLASSPNPVTNKELTKAVNNYISPKRIVAGVPKIILSILLGEMHRILFESCNATSEKIQKEGFIFSFPNIDPTLKDLLGK